jgi:hypothetical protein
MEAKVDIQKLQLLNDRITQAMEALDQVRLSVHGMSHTPAVDPWAVQQMLFRSGYGTPIPYAPQFASAQTQTPAIQHSVPVSSFVPAYGTVPVHLLAPQFQQPGLFHANPDAITQRMLEARYGAGPTRLSQTFPFLNLPGVVPSAVW